ncbi:Carbohydrate binding module (family 6) [Fibrobacter sp. UWH5]|uniref:carbohydrate-binding protein n=1 Tax=Fibrobacter sp. UWH5 TaxID=1896211 RepID=UPI00090F33C0|nr:cellulase family glycosylhydrolase [Fibrobacter sp. UWH5]SHL60538.1 Carbohydrate binding module (family 6) [Fibrobacter sp. UWH5]
MGKLVSVAAFAAVFAVSSFAVTNQFRGTNWADKRDNFVSDVLKLSGMTGTEDYQAAYALSDRVMSQFVEKLGINSLRIPINEPTALKAWSSYKGIIDGILAHGRMLVGYWGPAQPAGPKNMDDWWKMWDTVIKEYGDNPNAYFEIFNEPHMYTKDELRNLYAKWLARYPDVPRDHILLDGTGLAWNVPEIADDSRFDGCLFAVHEYTFWNMSITTEQGWMNSFKGKVGKYADRTVATEWGGAMGPGDKNGVHYEIMDYNDPNPTNYFMAYIRGMSEQLREWQMGSFYWVGLRDGDWYSMVTRSGEGANTKLEIVNQSGVDRMQYSWTDTVETTPAVQEPFDGIIALPGKIEAENYDKGGNRVSFYDKDASNQGNVYRDDAVDIVGFGCSDSLNTKDCEGYSLGYTQVGEWLEYSVNVGAHDSLVGSARVASGLEGAGFILYIDDKTVTDTVKIPKGGDWVTYSEIEFPVSEIAEGEHVLKLQFTGTYGNVDWVSLGDPNAVVGTRLQFNVATPQNYSVFTVNGNYVGTVYGLSAGIAEQVRGLVKNPGIYVAKPAYGPAVKFNVK